MAKRGEALLMRHFGLDTDAPSPALVDGKKAYDAVCKASLQPKYRSTIKELFPNTRVSSAASRRRAISLLLLEMVAATELGCSDCLVSE